MRLADFAGLLVCLFACLRVAGTGAGSFDEERQRRARRGGGGVGCGGRGDILTGDCIWLGDEYEYAGANGNCFIACVFRVAGG